MALAETGQVYTLHPGDVRLGQRGDRLATLLGSCVAVVLTDPRRTVGCMCHIVHAQPVHRTATRRNAAWGDVALGTMYAQLRAQGIVPHLCDAYVYGGGNMFPTLVDGPHVGQDNAAWVLKALAEDDIRVVHQDLGGHRYRRLSWTVGPETPVVEAVAV
ncbi:MAG: chemotaxis protein CheD [Burkholderiaceae bacterium]|nr:chemotaxis protein CheD [Rhodoferax sp.]MCP5286021.1 chemotaxis protein CheD [Burkholderiaceae bacterium]